ncbi:MAG: S-methyl-5-thioribose-1-phosphate isomerase [bacterium]|nr:S-methyl-5-thioribose-1-phosphate isomerase [bacterium]
MRNPQSVVETIKWEDGILNLIDQTRLPTEAVYLSCYTPEELAKAIKALVVRGAPAIGVAAAYGVVLGIKNSRARDYQELEPELNRVIELLASTRPTAVNLFWALNRMKQTAESHKHEDVEQIKRVLAEEAVNIHQDDKRRCQAMGEFGAGLIRDGDTILTHCNAGALATGGMGTALGVIYAAHQQGKKVKVFADETRPLLQGARLTAWELQEAGIEGTLICDNMAAQVMKEGKINLVLTGADRIVANGDTANKIGTYGVAILAKEHGIPFYVAAPLSTVDLNLKDGDQIPIEERSSEEVTGGFGKQTAPSGVKVYSPAFDVTPAKYITAIITEKGIVRPPYQESLAGLF